MMRHSTKKKKKRKKQSPPPLWENARLQSGYSHEIDKKGMKNKTGKILTVPFGLLALQAFRYNLSKDVNHGFQLTMNSLLQWLKTYRLKLITERFHFKPKIACRRA